MWDRQPWAREREPFEDGGGYENYPGATVLCDMDATADEASLLRILARYTVVRVLVLAAAGRLPGAKLLTERRIAFEHLMLLPSRDWERSALERLAEACSERPGPEVIAATLLAAECAAKRDHGMGAFGLFRAAYEIALQRGWWDDAGRAAAGAAQLARLHEARISTRLWRWRARVLAERGRRAAAAAAEEAQRLAEDAATPDTPADASDSTGEPAGLADANRAVEDGT